MLPEVHGFNHFFGVLYAHELFYRQSLKVRRLDPQSVGKSVAESFTHAFHLDGEVFHLLVEVAPGNEEGMAMSKPVRVVFSAMEIPLASAE